MTDWYQDVLDFHNKFGCSVADRPSLPPPSSTVLRINLIHEEVSETENAMLNADVVGVADGIADAIYVLVGAAITYGIDLRPVFAEVHRSNMAKEGGGTRADGKILKPPGWTPPDIVAELKKQGWEELP